MRLSKLLSIVLHPIFVPIISIYLSIRLIPSVGVVIQNYISYVYLILICCTIILPIVNVFFLVKTKYIGSIEMSNHKQRPLPLLLSSIWLILGYYHLNELLVFSPILRAILISTVVIVVVSTIVSKYWKISLHMLGAGGLVGVIFSLNILFGGIQAALVISILFSGILGVARIYENAHNHSQIYAGFSFGFIIVAYVMLII